MTTLIVIPCSGAKSPVPCTGASMYRGTLHRSARLAANRLSPKLNARIVTLSGLYGLVEDDQVIEPYDQRIDEPGAVTPWQIGKQLVERDCVAVVALLPSAYDKVMRDGAVNHAGVAVYQNPLVGARGVGEIRARLARIERTV